jgi:hypothetical protein
VFAKGPVVSPYTNSLGNILETEKNHSLKHAPNDIVNNVKWVYSINMSCEAPETEHNDWVKKQGGKTNEGLAVALCMVQHTVQKESNILLYEAVQGAFFIICACFTYSKRMHTLHSLPVHIMHFMNVLHILFIEF